MIKYPKNFKEEAINFRQKVNGFCDQKIDSADFKKYCAFMGVYAESGNLTYMTRIRVPAGIITLEQFETVNRLAKKFSKNFIHFTTRQDIQFHRLNLEDIPNLLEELSRVELYTKGAGGNCVRNVACSPLSEVSEDEIFDVTQYAIKTTEFLSENPASFDLPRKFKVSFSNSSADTAYATISDLGFIAKIKDGIKGFEVYAAGGLGLNPNISTKMEDFIPVNEYLYHVAAMYELFNKEGDRTNRNKARSRYILKKLGKKEFENLYNQYLSRAKEKYSFNKNESVGNFKTVHNKNFVYIHPPKGDLDSDTFDKVINFIKSLNYKVSIRLTSTQGFFIRELNHEDADKFKQEMTSELISQYDINNSVSCVGSSICKTGLCDSRQLLYEITQRFKAENAEIKAILPKIFISGCHNSCGQHQIGQIGLSGKLKKIQDELLPHYIIHFNGNIEANNTVLGESFGIIPAKNVPEFLYELALLKKLNLDITFSEFIKQKTPNINELIEKVNKL